jgi:hypothetical protein
MTIGSTVRCTLVSLIVAACGGRQADTASDAAPPAASTPPVIEIAGNEFAFQAPDTFPAGPVTVRLRNDGMELHHVQLVRLEEGKTLADLASVQTYVPWAELAGGPNSPAPGGGVSEVQVTLSPGNYAIICVIPSPDGVPHIAKGMMKAVTVLGPPATAVPPEPDLTVTLTDYDFVFSTPLTAGRHLLRVVVEATQPHEIFLARLEPGKSAEDLARWVEKPDGTPPGVPVGGTTGLNPGQVNLIPLDLLPGEYGLFCFMPDAKDGKPHIVYGMIKQIRIA